MSAVAVLQRCRCMITSRTMLQSMTGYGVASCVAADNAGRITVEIKSVNHRHLDLRFIGLRTSREQEDHMALALRKCLQRGSVLVAITLDTQVSVEHGSPDVAQADPVYAYLVALANRFGLEPPTLQLLVDQLAAQSRPGQERRTELDSAAVSAAFSLAVDSIVLSRSVEGDALQADIAARIDGLQQLYGHIAILNESSTQVLHDRLLQRIQKLLSNDTSIEPQRLAQEVALLVDRSDITEELVRFAAHVGQCRAALTSTEPVGRRLDFLVQELARELSTMAAKASSVEISHLTVEAKTVLEKLREQVQNVE
jgi:uncharacterized protein (TIGR00255 family)